MAIRLKSPDGTLWEVTANNDGSLQNTVTAIGDETGVVVPVESVLVRDLIKRAMRSIGAIASGETPDNAAMQDGLTVLNELLSSWGAEKLMPYCLHREAFPLQAGKGSYTIGDGADFQAYRPNKIELVGLVPSGSTLETFLDKPLEDEDWAKVSNKSASGQPTAIYYQKTYPLGTIYVYPKPTAVDVLVLYSWKYLNQYETIDDEIVLPPEYIRALRTNLAVDLAAEYGVDPKGSVILAARESKAVIKRLNARPTDMKSDSALLPINAVYNINTGEA